MLQKFLILIVAFGLGLNTYAQDAYLTADAEDIEKTYVGGDTYKVKMYPHKFKSEKPKNNNRVFLRLLLCLISG